MISDLIIDKEKTVCVSGHRVITKKIDREKLREIFLKFIDCGMDTFLIGMAIGFDTICFQILENIRKEGKKIRLVACIPCPNQDKNFSFEQKKEYKRMLDSADEKIEISTVYTPYCMIKRNRFMVDNSRILIAYLTENKGGTKNTVDYAVSKQVQTIILPND